MNDQTILALGEFCKNLLDAEAFQALTKLYAQQCAADMLQTKPSDPAAREQIHAAYMGFDNFLALAKKFADDYDLHTNPPTDTTEDDPRVHDIYEMN